MTEKRRRRGSSGSQNGTVRRTLLSDVAKSAGVSIATASRALSGASGVSDELRAKIVEIAAELHYEHNPIGRSLRSGKTHLVGVWVESISNASSGRLVAALNDKLHAHGYDMLVTEYSEDPEEDSSRIGALARRRPDFMVVLHPPRPEPFERLAERGQRVVMISSGSPEDWDGPLIAIDSNESRRELATDLAELGHRRLLRLMPLRRIGRPGFGALERAIEDEHLPIEVDLRPLATHDGDDGITIPEVIALLQSEDGPTFVQVNEAQAPIVVSAIAAAGLRIPTDVSVMATGDPIWAELHHPPLSTTDVDYYQCGVRAAELILEMENGDPPGRRTVRGQYIRRASVGPAPRRALTSTPPSRVATEV